MARAGSRHAPEVRRVVHVRTVDDAVVSIRPPTAADRRAIITLYAESSPANLRLRFPIDMISGLPAAEAERLCRRGDGHTLTLLAHADGRLVGVASCERTGDHSRAEFSIFLADRHHGRGIGTLLLRQLADRARRRHITELVGEALPRDARTPRIARDLGVRPRLISRSPATSPTRVSCGSS